MFSLSTACAFADDHDDSDDEETAEMAGRYFAELTKTQRSPLENDENGKDHRRNVKNRHKTNQRGLFKKTNKTKDPRMNRVSSSMALLGIKEKSENDEIDNKIDSISCNNLLLNSADAVEGIAASEYSTHSSDSVEQYFLLIPQKRNHFRKMASVNSGREKSNTTCLIRGEQTFGSTPGIITGIGQDQNTLSETGNQNRSTLLDMDKSDLYKANTVTLTTSVSNGDLYDHDRLSITQTPMTPSSIDIITINVSGLRFQTYICTLERFPDTLLGNPLKRERFYNMKTSEYFFDRHRGSFDSIMYYYQSDGKKLCRPENVPPDIFLKELQFFEMGPKAIDHFLRSQGCVRPKELELPKNQLQRRIWLLMEHPDSSFLARILAFISVFVIVISTLSFCLETIPELRYKFQTYQNFSGHNGSDNGQGGGSGNEESESFDNPFFLIELSCMCWFTLEFTLRFFSCPSKWEFCKSVLNIIDFVAIVPFFVNLAWASTHGAGGSTPPFAVLRIFRLVRVFRIFKLSRHSRGLQILGKTFTASVQELCLLIFFLILGLVLFSSAVYIAESGYDSGFDSIPASFWYVIVTMTTVGYGDQTPKGPFGKLVGGMCAIVGVLVLALPVPVIVANFKHYYRQEARLARIRMAQNESAEGEELPDDDDSHSS